MDDDPAVLKALSRLLRSRSFRARTYGSGQEFLASLQTDVPECLIVDLQMPDMNGVELQQHLVSNGINIPTILITAHGDAVSHSARWRVRCPSPEAIARRDLVRCYRQGDRRLARQVVCPPMDIRFM